MAGNPSIDPRRLVRLAAAARKAGITRLRLGELEFELGPTPTVNPESNGFHRLPIPDRIPEATQPPVGSSDWLRNRFGRKD